MGAWRRAASVAATAAFVVLEHGGGVSTLYGHLSRFAKDVGVGTRVKQGEVIGYVGMSGLADRPHLHYEYRVNGVHRNPQKVKFADASPISTDLRDDFAAKDRARPRRLESWSACAWPRSTSAVVEPAAPTGATGLRPKTRIRQPQGRLWRWGFANDELRALDVFPVVDLRAHQVLKAHRIDEQLDRRDSRRRYHRPALVSSKVKPY